MANQPTLSLNLEPLTSFLSLAPATSESYPHRRTASSSSVTASVSPSAEPAASANTTDTTATKTVPAPAGKELDLKVRRSSSLGSDGSNGSGRKLRFLSLGPVHHGEHLEGDGDWSEEIAIVE